MRRAWVLAVLLGGGCAAPPCQYSDEQAREMVRDPGKLHAYFLDQIRCGEYAKAHDNCLSKGSREALPYVQFYFVIQWELVRRMILGFEQHEVKVAGPIGTVKWCNREFGISREYRLSSLTIRGKRYWGYDFTREQLQDLKDAAFAWFKKQRDAADNRLYTYSPDWHHTPLGGACSCKRPSF